MKSSSARKKIINFLFSLIGSIFFVIPILGIYKFIILSNNANLPSKKIPVEIYHDSQADDIGLTNATLIDSIVTVIKNYYVDKDRVDNIFLLKNTANNLALNQEISLDKSNPDDWLITIGTKQIKFNPSNKISYNELLNILINICTGIETITPKDDQKNTAANILLNAMLHSLDAHSTLLSVEEYKELRQGTEGNFGGLGILVGIRDNILTILKPLPKSPALYAGLKSYDKILTINGVNTYGKRLDNLIVYMRGEPGTDVSLDVLGQKSVAPRHINLKRQIINVDSVSAKILKDPKYKIIYLKIDSFASQTTKEIKKVIKKFRKKTDGKIHGIILDLRANPGGLLDQAIQVSNLFLKSGVIVTTKGRDEESKAANSTLDKINYPMVLLLNEESASASEIVAGALQDHRRAIIIGRPSFGKGSVQTVFELPNKQALKLTVSRYYTPSGRSIQNVGITPDIWLQKVIKKNININLLGEDRYNNECFLDYHLKTSSRLAVNKYKNYVPPIKAYYLKDESLDNDFIETNEESDIELQLGKAILKEVAKTYDYILPESAQRSFHWLALASKIVNKKINNLNNQTESWLNKTFNIDWSTSSSYINQQYLELTVSPSIKEQVAYIGDEIEIPWQLNNISRHNISRVSIYATSNNPETETKEQLLGTIGAHKKKSGYLKFKIPPYITEKYIKIFTGIAIDSELMPAIKKEFLLKLIPKKEPMISIRTKFIDNPLAPKHKGTLDPLEIAKIKLDIINKSNIDINNIHISLTNLAGKQINIKNYNENLNYIEAGSQKSILIEIKAASTLYTDKMLIGLNIDSPNLLDTNTKNIIIAGHPNNKNGKQLSH